jgi:hypothetical protein
MEAALVVLWENWIHDLLHDRVDNSPQEVFRSYEALNIKPIVIRGSVKNAPIGEPIFGTNII